MNSLTSRRAFIAGASAIALAPITLHAPANAAQIDGIRLPANLADDPWWALHARLHRLEAASERYWARSTQLPEPLAVRARSRSSDLSERAHEMRWELLQMPAPDAQAALWKFDYMMAPDEGETPAWNLAHANVRATFADIRRCLGGEA